MKLTRRTFLLGGLMVAVSVAASVLTPNVFLAEKRTGESLKQLIPTSFDGWKEDTQVAPLSADPRVDALLANVYTETLARTFVNANGHRVMLSLAYGKDQRGEGRAHYPEICYPAQGFQIRDRRSDVASIGAVSIPVVRLVGVQGERTEPITYWVVVGNEIVISALQHKATILQYGVKGQIPDGLLVRISSLSSDQPSAFALHDQFATSLSNALTLQQRGRLLGTLASR